MINIKKAISLFLAMTLMATSAIEALAGTSIDDALNKASLYVRQEQGPQLLTWKGMVDPENFAPAVISYQAEDGKEYPAYCANPNKPGVENMASKKYDVDIDQLDTNPQAWGVITNGYPYKTLEELGVNNEYEAYYATKMAVWAVVHPNYSNLDDWKANGAHNGHIEKLMKSLVEKGRATPFVPATWMSLTPKTQIAEEDFIDKNLLSQEFTVKSNVDISSYTVIIKGSLPSGAKVTDMQNKAKTSFAGDEPSFKVIIPKANKEREGNFEVIVKAVIQNKAVLFGLSHDTKKQDYYVSPSTTRNAEEGARAVYKEGQGTTPPPPDIPDIPQASKGLQILKVKAGTTQGLAGAVFKITDVNGGVIGHYVTDKTGQIVIPDMPIGAYYIEETAPPYGFVLDKNNHKDVIVKADEATIVTFSNEEIASLEITKIDEDTGDKLYGAVFRVALDGGSDFFDVHTDASGVARLANLKSGTYTVTEITAPEGYLLNSTPQSLKLEAGKKATITMKNRAKPGLIIKKFDEDTVLPLPGAEFSVAKKGGSVLYEGITDRAGQIKLENLEPDWYTVTEIAPPKGYLMATESKDVKLEPNKVAEIKFDNRLRPSLQIQKIDSQTNEPLEGAVFKVVKTEDKTESEYVTDKTGTILIHDLDEAVYTVSEVKSPDGYLLEEQHKDIALEWGKTKTLVFENKAKPKLEILKVDEATKEPLAGAKFKITRTEGNTTSEYITDEDGRILIENLEAEIYTVEEIAAPNGYLLGNQHKDVELEWGKTKQVVFTNKKKPSLEILKVDEATKEPLAGAKFKITRTEGNTTSEYITDDDGRILIENLEAEIYTVEEIAAPDGYLLENQHKDVELEWGKTKQVVFTNKKKPSLEILKVDEATKEPLAGAKFKVTRTENNTTSEYITDEDGRILIENLEAEIYTVEEIVPPDNYLLEEQHKDIELEWGKTKQVVFTNKKRPVLEIKKIDFKTKEPLAGAKFKVTKTEDKTVSEYMTDETGVITIEKLDAATYTVEEVTAPSGYLLDPQHKEIALEWGKTKTLIYEDTRKPTLIINKINGLTFKPIPNTTYKIEYEAQNGGLVPLGTYRTDKNGQIILPKIDVGWYVITEIKAAPGFSIPSNPVTRKYLVAGENAYTANDGAENKPPENGGNIPDGEIHPPESGGNSPNVQPPTDLIITSGNDYILGEDIINYPLNSLVLKKVDANTSEMLAGAVFELRKVTEDVSGSSGTVVGRYTTDNSGIVVITGLEPGGYVVEEVKPPTHYLLYENSQQQAWMKPDGTSISEITFANYPYGSILVTKVDAQTGKPLANARFKVTDGSHAAVGNTNGEYTTDENGEFLVPNVKPDSYVITELEAPENYVLDTTPQTVQVGTDGKVYKVSFKNQPLGSLVILKKDFNTKEPLSHAEFKVTTSKGNVVGTGNGIFKTDKDGSITIPNLQKDSYIVEEIKAPSGYLLENQSKTIAIDYGKTNTLTFYNKPLSSLVIQKIDAKTKEPLSGARFKISKKSGDVVGEFTTNSDGLIQRDELSPGWYSAVEVKAPSGYLLNEVAQDFEITHSKTITLTFTNEMLTSLIIKKTDDKTGEPLGGAKFSVEKQDGRQIGDFTTDKTGAINIPTLEPGWYIVRESKAPEGFLLDETPKTVEVKTDTPTTVNFTNKQLTALEIKKTDDKTGEPLGGARFVVEKQNGERVGEYTTDKAGMISIPTLDPDWYVVKETQSPDGYLLDESPKTVEVKTNAPTVVTFLNKQLTALVIKKEADKTGEPLSGAKFAVEKQNGERVGEYTTDKSGIISIPTLDPDWYVVKETKAPDGFLLDETPKTVEVKTTSPTVITFVNKPLAALQIKKVDELTGDPLSGADFKVTKQNGEVIGEYTTEKDGFINVPTLSPGHYSVSETNAPDGYILDNTPKTVEIVTGRPTSVTFLNKPLSGLKIIKLDSVTRKPLDGVEFAVAKMNGEKVGNFKTDNTGQIYISELADGYYTVTEIKGLEGYISDKEPKTVQIQWGKPTILEVTNEPYPALVIKKTAGNNGKPLEGVKFMVAKPNGEQIGIYKTDRSGRIEIEGLEEGRYVVTETETVKGYQLDSEAKEVIIKYGKRTVLEVTNDPLSSIIIRKIDSVTKEGIYGVTFLLYDEKDNPLGQFISDNEGYVWLDKELEPGKYKLRELKPADGYLPDDVPRTIYVKSGQTTEVIWENTPQKGQIVITKRSSDFNAMTGLPAGSPLAGASFEVYNVTGNLVDKMVSDNRGIAGSKPLPTGVYVIKEVSAPRYYGINTKELLAEIRHNGDIVKFEVLNSSIMLDLTVQKKGPNQASPGQNVVYELYDIANKSSGVLENFYIHDRIPTDATRVTKVVTGTYNERMYYKVTYKTNYQDYRVLAENLLTKNSYEYSLHPNALSLAAGEYVTDVRLEFPKASPGFKSEENMVVFCQVLPTVPKDYKIVNRADVGGRYSNEWESKNTSWNTTVWAQDVPSVALPKTGY